MPWFPEPSTTRKAKYGEESSDRPLTLKHLAAAISEDHELSKKAAEAILGDLIDRIARHLKKGERVRIVGLGILQVRKRAARMGRNPATGEPIQIKASKKVAFRAAKELKEAVCPRPLFSAFAPSGLASDWRFLLYGFSDLPFHPAAVRSCLHLPISRIR